MRGYSVRILHILAIVFFYASIAYLAFKSFTSDQDDDDSSTKENERHDIAPGGFATNPEGNDSAATPFSQKPETKEGDVTIDSSVIPVGKPKGYVFIKFQFDVYLTFGNC